jgi:hypothetical protein
LQSESTLVSDCRFVLDIGGEGRYLQAWNLNRSRVKTFGCERGQPIPRLIQARGDGIPLPSDSVDLVIVERTPLRLAALAEIARVARQSATIVLRHAIPPGLDPHRLALQVLGGDVQRRMTSIGTIAVQETVVRLSPTPENS